MYNTETNFYTRVKLNLILFFFFFSSIILLLVTPYWKNIVEYSYFRKHVKDIAKPFHHLSEKTVSTYIYRNSDIYLFFFFLLKSKEDQGIKVFIKLSYVRRFLQQIFILFFIFFPERVYPRRYIFHFYRNCTVPNVTFIIGN